MTEREVFTEGIDLIAEMSVIAKELSQDEYYHWKTESVNHAAQQSKEAGQFMKKVFVVIGMYSGQEKEDSSKVVGTAGRAVKT